MNKGQMKTRFLAIMFFGIILMAAGAFAGCKSSDSNGETSTESTENLNDRYRSKVKAEFKKRANRHNADTRYLIIVDYSILSNHDRLFVWDTEKDGIVEKFWCAHGNGGGSTAEKPVFSNVPGSKCSSLGWYLVGRDVGKSPRWGYFYHPVDGLDATNSNARGRQILIHPWYKVDNDYAAHLSRPMTLDGRCEGCFTTTTKGYQTLDKLIKSRQKRILLWAIKG